MRVILENITLCSIVKNELSNRAGGIVDFVRTTVQFVQESVIVDTGSDDGTREALVELSEEYPALRVYSRRFDDFASSRNYSLEQVRTPRVLILDADERLSEDNFETIRFEMDEIGLDYEGYNFYQVLNHLQDGEIKVHNWPFLLRIFSMYEKVHFRNSLNKSAEGLWHGDKLYVEGKKIGKLSVILDHYSEPKDYNTDDGLPIRL